MPQSVLAILPFWDLCTFANENQVIGIQHFKLAQMLLAIFDPTIPRLGGNRRVAVHSMEAS